jgi:hypothetical protein
VFPVWVVLSVQTVTCLGSTVSVQSVRCLGSSECTECSLPG